MMCEFEILSSDAEDNLGREIHKEFLSNTMVQSNYIEGVVILTSLSLSLIRSARYNVRKLSDDLAFQNNISYSQNNSLIP